MKEKKEEEVAVQEFVPKKFSEVGLNEWLIKNLIEVGIDKPTQIQQETLIHSLKGRNIIGCAHTGSGKTACFALPIL